MQPASSRAVAGVVPSPADDGRLRPCCRCDGRASRSTGSAEKRRRSSCCGCSAMQFHRNGVQWNDCMTDAGLGWVGWVGWAGPGAATPRRSVSVRCDRTATAAQHDDSTPSIAPPPAPPPPPPATEETCAGATPADGTKGAQTGERSSRCRCRCCSALCPLCV